MAWRKGESGNPSGRTPGAISRLTQQADALAKKYGYDAFERQILLAKRVEAIVQRNGFRVPGTEAPDWAMRLRHFELLQKIYRDTMPYQYPQLKAIEITDGLGEELDEQSVAEQRESLAFLLRQVRELADEQGVTEDGDASARGVA